MKTLYVSDLDGTLLNAESRLSPATVAMLSEAIRGGALFSVATARTPATVSVILRDVPVSLPQIVMTGSALWDPQADKLVSPRFLKREAVERMIGIYIENSLPAFIYTLGEDGRIHIFHSGDTDERENIFINERARSPYKVFHLDSTMTPDMAVTKDNVLLFYSMQQSGLTRKVYDILRRDRDLNPVFYFDIFGPEVAIMEVFDHDTSKASAVRRLAAMTGADRVVAFGDNINDLPMLRDADLAVAVGNAVEEVKAAADVVIGVNTSDAVARFILDDYTQNR